MSEDALDFTVGFSGNVLGPIPLDDAVQRVVAFCCWPRSGFVGYDLAGHVARTKPFTIYPKVGTLEVVFQHMRRRPVFSDPTLREEFRQRLQTAGISIPEAKLNLRPSFQIDVLRSPAALTAVKSALEWFALVYRTRLTQERQTDLPDLGEVLGLV